jgi:hypothetical protein
MLKVIKTLSVTSLCYFISVGHFRGSTGKGDRNFKCHFTMLFY